MMENSKSKEEKIEKKEIEGIKDIVLRNLKNLERINNFWSNNYIEYKRNGDKNGILLAE